MSACPICDGEQRRRHTEDEMRVFHPLAIHGYSPQTGWTSEAAKVAHDLDVLRLAEETAVK